MTTFFCGVMALSAFLVFWLQPLVARMLLPALGGSPAVWNTCVLFFQGALLVGYLYAHGLTKLSLRNQGIVHLTMIVFAVVLAPSVEVQWTPGSSASTVLWVLRSLILYVGLPFIVLSSTAPLLQHWFGMAETEKAKDPYFLYAASNVGSLLALLLFPVVLERYLPITTQLQWWNQSFILLSIAILICAGLVFRNPVPVSTAGELTSSWSGKATVKWLAYSFVPSSLMLGVTTHITTDIAAISLFWVLPLALYLLTYIIAFSGFGAMANRVSTVALPFLIIGLLVVVFRFGMHSILLLPIQLGIVACVSQILHCRLYDSRPARSSLTLFYLRVAFGGFLGGFFNGLLAPMLFDGVVEFQLVLATGVVMANWQFIRRFLNVFTRSKWHGLTVKHVAGIVALAVAIAFWISEVRDLRVALLVTSMLFTSALASTYAVGPWVGVRFAALFSIVLFLGFSVVSGLNRGVYSDRSFFGPFRVQVAEISGTKIRSFIHGTTVHGIQAVDSPDTLTLQSYYAAIGPVVGDFLAGRDSAHIGITGLGTGNSACVGRANDQVTFYEIDRKVEWVARQYFTYLEQCPPEIDVVIGDGRQSLQQLPDNSFDVLILDAFTSDAVPIHLLTDEAAAVYERVLKDDGLMAFNISNRYLDLTRVLATLAMHRGWTAWKIDSEEDPDNPLSDPSTFILVGASSEINSIVSRLENAEPIDVITGSRLWTDEYSNVIEILLW